MQIVRAPPKKGLTVVKRCERLCFAADTGKYDEAFDMLNAMKIEGRGPATPSRVTARRSRIRS
jgi:hypothetical protein